ncbi:MAG TPA: hypothetical protein VK157_09025 [Phycisphaerales bacterium]|nr:hypothetical protein [Phycisphaerales bacterium]
MNDLKLDLFETWAPPRVRWSAWAKPVLFMQDRNNFRAEPYSLNVPDDIVHATAQATSRAAVVIDLPGSSAVALALALARRGMRPVPLHNCSVGPGVNTYNAHEVILAYADAGRELLSLKIPDDAAPVFIIDSARLRGFASPNMYDNRWMVFPQDFPSARALREANLTRVVLVRRGDTIEHDLRTVLRGWKRDGVEIELFDLDRGSLTPLTYSLSWLGAMGDVIRLAFTGLRTNSAGGFGGVVPDVSSGGGGYA